MTASDSGSSAGSGASSDPSVAELSNLRPGEDDEFAIDEGRAFSNAINGVLYTVSKEKTPGAAWAAFRLSFDALQLWLIMVNPTYGYQGFINPENKLWQVVSLINMTQFLAARGYSFFLALLYIMVVFLLIAIGLCVWVGHSFQNNRFDHVWPIVLLRFYSIAFFQVLDIASLTLFLVALDCQFYFTDQPSRYTHQEFPEIQCLTMPHMIHMAVAILSLLVFAVMAGLFAMSEMELNPLSRNPLAMAHTRVEVLAFALKFVMTSASTLLVHLKWLSTIEAACALVLLYLYWKWVPHLNVLVNDIRVGTSALTFYCAVMLLLLGFLPGVDVNEPDGVQSFRWAITYAMWAGLVPSFLLGMVASRYRQKWFMVTVLEKFREAPVDAKPSSIYKFTDVREVEILGRCCRVWVEEDVVDEERVKLAEVIMKNGTQQLPNNAFMVILYSSFLIDVQTSYQSGYSILQMAKKHDPSFFERFALFSREQQHAQKSGDSGGATDLVSYVEFQRNYRLVLKVHKEALMAVKMFWMTLTQRKVKFDNMSACLERIELTVKAAERTYRNVLQRHANNMKVVRLYARFLEQIKHDPWAAAKWAAEAEKLEQLAEENKASNVFNDMEGLDPALRHSLQAMGGPMSESRSFMVIDAQGMVQATNQSACDLFGYLKTELVGRSVNQIIPPPFAEHHNNYIRAFLNTGKSRVLNKTTNFVALHKERHLVRVCLNVTKVSGIGEDTLFLGVIEAAPPLADTAFMYVLFNSQLLCVDPTFSDWFAYRNDEVVGTHLNAYVVDFKGLDEALRAARQATALLKANTKIPDRALDSSVTSLMPNSAWPLSPAATRTASVVQEMVVGGVQVAHKYADAVPVDCTITTSSVGSHQFTVLMLKRHQSSHSHAQREMLVSDPKGRVLHVTQGLAAKLGSTARLLLGNDNKNALSQLMVQPFGLAHNVLGSSVPSHSPPAYSCRSGLSFLMASTGPQGPDATAFRMHLKRKQQGGEHNVWHVATLEHRTLSQAVQERCLQLVLDSHGYVVDVPMESTAMPFGVRPITLVGNHISALVDIMSPKHAAAAASAHKTLMGSKQSLERPVVPSLTKLVEEGTDADMGYVSAEHEETVSSLLLEMATKSLDEPGVSWRCGVMPRSTGKGAGAGHVSVSALLGRIQAKPGILSVSFVLEETPSAAASPRQDRFATNGGISVHSINGRADLGLAGEDQFFGQQPGNASSTVSRGNSFTAALDREPAPISPNPGDIRRKSVLSTMDNVRSLRYKVKIWRTKFCSSLMEVDGAGRVVGHNPEDRVQALYPAGLILGVPGNDMYGQPINMLVPIGSRGIAGLLEDTTRKKSLLKTAVLAGDDKMPGPVHILNAKHFGDEQDIQLTVQAVPRLGRLNHTFLLLHAHNAKCGRPDFITWVLEGGLRKAEPEVDKYLERQLSRSSYGALPRKPSALPAPPAAGNSKPRKAVLPPEPESVPPLASFGEEANVVDAEIARLNMLPGLVQEDQALEHDEGVLGGEAREERSSSFDETRAINNAAQNARLVRWVAASSEAAMGDVGDAPGAADEAPDNDAQDSDNGDKEEESRNAATLSEVQQHAGANTSTDSTDYRRGKRYKKLMRVLSSAVMQQRIKRFRIHTIAVVVFLLLAHFGIFALMFVLLSGQTAGVTDLNNAGVALRYAGEVGLVTRQLQQLYEPIPVASPVELKGMTNASDIPPLREWYRKNLDGLKSKHAAFYLGSDGSGRRLPNINGLRSIWEEPTLPEAVVYAIPWNESIDFNASNIYMAKNSSLWDIGNRILAAGNQIYTNADWRIKTYGNISSWFMFEYLMTNMPNVLADNYYITMDTMVDFVLEGARTVNQWQTVVLAVEGCVLCLLAIAYVWYLAVTVGEQRFNVYGVFLAVPHALVRGLATRKMELDENEDEEDELGDHNLGAGGPPQLVGAPSNQVADKASLETLPPPPKGTSGMGSITLFVRGGVAGAAAPHHQGGGFLASLKFWTWLSPASKDPHPAAAAKRQLIQSYRQPMLLTWPFLLWGCTIVVTYAIGVMQLAQISGPIATFNMVNFVTVRTHLFFFELQELVIEFNQTKMDQIRQRVGDKLFLLQKDYTAMMYGGQALPNETAPHFTLATLGLTYAGGKASEILFKTTSCLCEDVSNCNDNTTGLYYDDTHNGLARLLNSFIKNSDAVRYMRGLDPWLFGPEFAWFWYVRFDILGGLAKLNDYYQSYVLNVYNNAVKIHIAALIITCVLMLGYLLLVLRPFIRKATNEAKRIAELLSQLPPEVDVETLVMRTLPTKGGGAQVVPVGGPAPSAYGNKSSGALSGGRHGSFANDGLD